MHRAIKTPSLGGAWALSKVVSEQIAIENKLAEDIIAYYGLSVSPIGDGEIHRHDHPEGRKGNKRLWYVLRHDFGVHGDWATGEQHSVFTDESPDPEAAEKARQEAEKHRLERQAERARGYAMVADQTRREWPLLTPASATHAYLAAKGVKPHNLRQMRGLLVIPLTDGHRLVNWQTIAPDGAKYFKAGGKVKGCYSPIGSIEQHQPLLIAEGWATAATLHEATGYAVAAAMNAGNLLPVAKSLRERYPAHPIIVCADNDHGTAGNPGVTRGKEAASAIGASCVWPETHEGVTDFNDLARLGEGLAL
ncbi:toprim domain-containing protein [Halomonas sp. CSM-2]|uniref:toprim domain-containing protein n=1 Tax=Halomonas sp. CSM-2 TaxID=1975722 RepID=UPI001592DC40|nr:toprim domain-containing protein [Halomonas sp. CSM-2]